MTDVNYLNSAASWVMKVGGGAIFRHAARLFLTEDIMAAQNFNFVPQFPPNGGFSAPNFVF